MSCVLRLASLSFLLLTSAMCCRAAASSNLMDAAGDDVVVVSVYYETLCPFCAEFIVNHLVKLFEDGLISVVRLRMIPWGNGLVQSDGSLICQHGPDECFLNAVEGCTISVYPDTDRHFRFIHCIARLSLQNRINEWMSCFELSGLGSSPVDCYAAGYGNAVRPTSAVNTFHLVTTSINQLENNYAAETSQLNPPHRFVPWVVVNDQPLQEDFKNFMSYICKAYEGSPVPDACKFLPEASSISSLQEEKSASSVCFLGEMSNQTSHKYLVSNMRH